MTALVTRDDLKSAIDAGTVTVVDTLGGQYYASSTCPAPSRWPRAMSRP